jgi:hypothetical protein
MAGTRQPPSQLVVVGPVVGGVEHDGVVGDPELVEQVEELADVHVVLHHPVGVLVLTRYAAQLLLHMRAEMHPGAAPPDEERLPGGDRVADEADGRIGRLIVHRLHALLGEGAGVLDAPVGPAVDHPSRAKRLVEGAAVGQYHVARVVLVLGLFLGIEMVEVAEELIEPVIGGQELVLVAQVVLAELPGGVTQVLQNHRDRRILDPKTQIGAREPHL